MTTTPMTRRDVERIVREARERGERPDLRWVDLSGLDLHGADLRRANLRGADLRDADLRRADLSGANLRWADIRWTPGVIPLGATPSGDAHMVPLPTGEWRLTVGCWDGTTTDLRTLIAGDDWPEAVGVEQARRRPILESLADHADNLAAYHDDWLTAVVKRWGDTNKENTR